MRLPLYQLLPLFAIPCDSLRVRRQAWPPRPSVYQPRVEDYNLPPFYQPHPGRDASSLTPIFPFTSEYNSGLDVNPGTRVTVDGNLNVPIVGWGIWDYKGGVKVGRPNTRVGFGSLNRPTNVLGISPETISALGNDKIFNEARERVPSIPVSVLPGNFVPLRCKPPFCNPFLHNLAFGVDVEPGDDYLADLGMDFPLPLGPSGVGVRFPLSGAINVGTDPLLITYGHGMGPVEPPGFRLQAILSIEGDLVDIGMGTQGLLGLLSLFPLVLTQRYGDNDPIVIPTTGLANAFPNVITSNNFPLFPFTDQFNTGIELNPANKVSLAGDLNVPVPGWGQFDVDGNLYFGNINFDTKIGYQIAPTNHLNIKPETLALLGQNPAFREARKKVQEVVVGRVPYGYEPIKCKPPFCNPFVHHTAVGVEVEQGDDSFFIGGIDFPFPLGPDGAGVRFPLSGAVEQGTSPFAYAHGHAFNPVSPFDLKSLQDDSLPASPRKARRKESTKEKLRRKKFWIRNDKDMSTESM